MLALKPPSGLALVGDLLRPISWQDPVTDTPSPPTRPAWTRISFAKFPILHAIAALAPAEEVRQMLIARPSLLESTDGYGRTPLIVACMFGDRQVVRLLLDLGANTTARSYDGRTPLIHAARRGDATITQELLLSGADKSATDSTDLDAFYSAMLCGHVITSLRPQDDISVGPPSCIPFADIFVQVATLHGFDPALSLAAMFAGLGGNIQIPGRHVGPPLGHAIDQADAKAIRALAELGACINCCSEWSLRKSASPAVISALNAAWDAFTAQLKGIAPDTYLQTLPLDMLRYIINFMPHAVEESVESTWTPGESVD